MLKFHYLPSESLAVPEKAISADINMTYHLGDNWQPCRAGTPIFQSAAAPDYDIVPGARK